MDAHVDCDDDTATVASVEPGARALPVNAAAVAVVAVTAAVVTAVAPPTPHVLLPLGMGWPRCGTPGEDTLSFGLACGNSRRICSLHPTAAEVCGSENGSVDNELSVRQN